MSSFARAYRRFEEKDAQVLGISMDSHHSQRMCVNSMGGVPYPVLGDFFPHGEVTQAYDVFNEERGNPRRSVFIIDKEGVVRYVQVYQQGLPDPEVILAELEKIAA